MTRILLTTLLLLAVPTAARAQFEDLDVVDRLVAVVGDSAIVQTQVQEEMQRMVERAARLQRLDDSTSSLLEAYAKLIKSAQVHGATEQQVSSFQSSVLVAGLVSIANSNVPGRHRVPTALCAPPRAAARHR